MEELRNKMTTSTRYILNISSELFPVIGFRNDQGKCLASNETPGGQIHTSKSSQDTCTEGIIRKGELHSYYTITT